MPGELKIAGFRFEVEKAVLRGHVDNTAFFWTLKIYSHGKMRDEEVEPHAYSENLLGLRNRSIERWTDIVGRALIWDESYDEESGTTQAALYVCSHEDIDQSTLVFSRDENELSVKWEGVTDVSSEEFDEYDEITFSVETPVVFEGFSTHRIPKEKALDELRKWVTGERFKEPVPELGDSLLFEVVE